MTTIKFAVDDERLATIETLLRKNPFIRDLTIENDALPHKENKNQYQRIQNLLNEAEGKNLFKDIEDPVSWQREIRKEWDLDI